MVKTLGVSIHQVMRVSYLLNLYEVRSLFLVPFYQCKDILYLYVLYNFNKRYKDLNPPGVTNSIKFTRTM